jgi:DNA-binding transcriptional LysR family regulator
VATFQSAGATLVPRALGEFHRRYPEVELTVMLEEYDARGVLARGEADVGILMDFHHTPLLAPELELVPLLDDPYGVVLPLDHPLADRTAIDMSELVDERFVMHHYGMGCREGIVHACRTAGFDPQVAIECDENEQLQAFVAAGLGVAVYPRLALAPQHPKVAVVPLADTKMQRRVWVATMAEGYRSPATEAMIGILTEVAAEFVATEIEAVA